MIFITQSKYKNLSNKYRAKLLLNAEHKIFLYPINPVEIRLNNYLIKKYNVSLRMACLKILNDIKFMKDFNGHIIGKVISDELSNLAHLITFGNGEVQGSKILIESIK